MSEKPVSRNTTVKSHDHGYPSSHPSEQAIPYETPNDLTSVSSATPFLSFQSATIAPSPPSAHHPHDRADGPTLHNADNPLRISTDLSNDPSVSALSQLRESPYGSSGLSPSRGSAPLKHRTSSNSLQPSRTPSLKAALTNSYGYANGPGSDVPSPVITAMGDMTPLPSPLLSGDSPGPWKKLSVGSVSPPQFRSRLRSTGEGSVLVSASGEAIETAVASAPRRKIYKSLDGNGTDTVPRPIHSHPEQEHLITHSQDRSVSEYFPDAAAVPKKLVTVSASHVRVPSIDGQEPQIRREANLAESRGLIAAVMKPPTPPLSESAKDPSDSTTKVKDEYFEACGRRDSKKRRWRSVRLLGEGTFSRVMLATSQMVPDSKGQGPSMPESAVQTSLERRKLVAVKVCEHGPRGGASEDRVEMSLKRELDIMQAIRHPSLVDLKAWNIEPTRAILILSYCPGGDMFDVATAHRNLLVPSLLRRMFAEIVGAVQYLHCNDIVHRDIKLENILVNLTAAELGDKSIDWVTYPYSVVTVTDLGLSRRVKGDEKLETRCGSDDYAAPEVIMGQAYDGRATDAWSLGVLLYALLETRLPFDAHPGMTDAHRMRSKTSHRIARVEWCWIEYAGEDGDHEASEAKFREMQLFDAMNITEGLLKRARSRWSLSKVAQEPWVAEAIQTEGGLRFREQDEGEEVL